MYLGKAVFLAAAMLAVPAAGDQIIFSQPPAQRGGFASDTDFTTESGIHDYWQRVADNVQLSQDAQVSRVSWYGFYYLNGLAPADETMRLRFYGSRVNDGLPDEGAILYERTLENPIRQATGFRLPISVGPNEYKYSVTLTTPVSLLSNTTYWVEIAQIGDPDYDFYWETAHGLTHDGIASVNPNFPNWDSVGGLVDLAFELSTPEPSSVCLFFTSLLFISARHRRQGFLQPQRVR